jgi:hypothetical protein
LILMNYHTPASQPPQLAPTSQLTSQPANPMPASPSPNPMPASPSQPVNLNVKSLCGAALESSEGIHYKAALLGAAGGFGSQGPQACIGIAARCRAHSHHRRHRLHLSLRVHSHCTSSGLFERISRDSQGCHPAGIPAERQ